jgi:hypothetical protein
MLTKPARHSSQAFTILEMLFASGVFAVGLVMVLSIFIFCLRSFTAMSNYMILDVENREAMDRVTKEIREAREVLNYSTSPPSLTIRDGGSAIVTYTFNGENKTMTRSSGGNTRVMLSDCSLLNFKLSQRNPKDGAYDLYPIATADWAGTVKVVELTWKTRRTIGGTLLTNSENIQTARIVIRKQQN